LRGFGGCDGASERSPPVAVDDVYDVEDHHAVRFAEVHLHGPFELHGVAPVVLDVHAADEGMAAQQTPRVAAAALDREVVAVLDLAVGLVSVRRVAAAVLLDGDGPVVVAVGVDVQQVGVAVVAVLGRRPVELLRRVVGGGGLDRSVKEITKLENTSLGDFKLHTEECEKHAFFIDRLCRRWRHDQKCERGSMTARIKGV